MGAFRAESVPPHFLSTSFISLMKNFPHAEIGPISKVSALALCILLLTCGPAQAQVRDGRHNLPSAQAPAPQPGTRQATQRAYPTHSTPSVPGTKLPPATRPADPPSTLGHSSRSTGPRGNAETSAPDTPPGPAQAPVDGGLGWLAVAGAAYAANRLRRQATSDDDA